MNPGKSVAAHHVSPVLNLFALQRDVIRMVAFLAMVGDHLATAFQLDMPLLNMAGRCVCASDAGGALLCQLAGTGLRTTPAGRSLVCTSVCPPPAVYRFYGQCSLTCLL
ncbi:conjugal transfer protein TraX [Salmonella enterica]|nr:conjugal transfer protein TraX [Salmonella enterica]